MNSHYSMLIQWSEEDQAYLVNLPEWTGTNHPHTHGETYEEAARNGAEVIELLIEFYREENRPLPEPSFFHFEENVSSGAI